MPAGTTAPGRRGTGRRTGPPGPPPRVRPATPHGPPRAGPASCAPWIDQHAVGRHRAVDDRTALDPVRRARVEPQPTGRGDLDQAVAAVVLDALDLAGDRVGRAGRADREP